MVLVVVMYGGVAFPLGASSATQSSASVPPMVGSAAADKVPTANLSDMRKVNLTPGLLMACVWVVLAVTLTQMLPAPNPLHVQKGHMVVEFPMPPEKMLVTVTLAEVADDGDSCMDKVQTTTALNEQMHWMFDKHAVRLLNVRMLATMLFVRVLSEDIMATEVVTAAKEVKVQVATAGVVVTKKMDTGLAVATMSLIKVEEMKAPIMAMALTTGATKLPVPSQARGADAWRMSNQSHVWRESVKPELYMATLGAAMSEVLLTPIVPIALITGERVVLVMTHDPVPIKVILLQACTMPAAEALDVRNERLTPEFLVLFEGVVKAKEVVTNNMSTAVQLATMEVATAEERWTPIVSMAMRTGEPVVLVLTQEPVSITVMWMVEDMVPATEVWDVRNKRLTPEMLMMLDEVMISDVTTASLVATLAAATAEVLLTPIVPIALITGERVVLVMTQDPVPIKVILLQACTMPAAEALDVRNECLTPELLMLREEVVLVVVPTPMGDALRAFPTRDGVYMEACTAREVGRTRSSTARVVVLQEAVAFVETAAN